MCGVVSQCRHSLPATRKLSSHRVWPAPYRHSVSMRWRFTLLWIGRSNLRLSERIGAVHYPAGVQSIDAESRRCEGEDSHKAVQETCEQSPAQRKNCQNEKEA